VATFAASIAPLQSGTCQIEVAKRWAVLSERKKSRTNIVQITGQGQLLRIECASGSVPGFQNEHAPSVASQGCGGNQTIWTRTYDDRIDHLKPKRRDELAG
jgi:hypothetical protein